MSERFKTKIQFNGREYASADEMPASIRAAYDRAVHETPVLHSGARLAAKLKAKIIVTVAVVYLEEHRDAQETRRLVEEHGRKCLLIDGDVGDEPPKSDK